MVKPYISVLVAFGSLPDGTLFWSEHIRNEFVKDGRKRAYTMLKSSGRKYYVQMEPSEKVRIQYFEESDQWDAKKLRMQYDRHLDSPELLLM